MARHAFIHPIMDVNTGPYRTSVRNLANGVRDHVTALDENGVPTTNPDLFTGFELAGVVPSVEAYIWVGWHPLVAANILDRYFDLQYPGLQQIAFSPAPMTEDFIIARLKQFANEHGCAKFWLIRPGDSLTVSSPADLLSRFADF
jgi:hypothetical protein